MGCRGVGLGGIGVALVQPVMGGWDIGVVVSGLGFVLVACFRTGLCFGSVAFALTASAGAGSVSAKRERLVTRACLLGGNAVIRRSTAARPDRGRESWDRGVACGGFARRLVFLWTIWKKSLGLGCNLPLLCWSCDWCVWIWSTLGCSILLFPVGLFDALLLLVELLEEPCSILLLICTIGVPEGDCCEVSFSLVSARS